MFNTCFGRYRYLRLPFGVTPAPEVYQKYMHELFDDLDAVETIKDDILVYCNSKVQHDERLEKVLTRCKERKFKVQPCQTEA